MRLSLKLRNLSFILLLLAAVHAYAQSPADIRPGGPTPRLPPGGIRPSETAPLRLTMRSVRVEQQRESGGDRPYFVSIVFQSQLYQRGSTRVEVVEREPHDWVGKPEYRRRGRVSAGRDHLFTGESLSLPEWMGNLRWESVTVVEPSDALRARPSVLGALIFGFDNNNTPPHVVRGLMEQLGAWLTRFLRQEVESGSILSAFDLGANTVDEAALRQKFETFALQMLNELDKGRIVETALQATFGSTFNPDKLVGVHAFVFPTVRGLPLNERAGRFSLPLLGERVNWNLIVGTPETTSRTLAFEGSGAHYTVPMSLSSSTLAAEASLSEIQLKIATGSDDLRRNSRARAFVTLRGGRRSSVAELNRGAEWSSRSENDATVVLPRGMRLSDLESLTITFESGSTGAFDTGDNWDVDTVTVTQGGGAGVIKVARGRPLVRFTGTNRSFTIPLR